MWPMAMGAARLGQIRQGPGAPGRVGAQGGGHAHLGLVGARSLGRKTPYGGAQRWPAVTTTVAATTASATHGLDNKRR
jgi:hypothetical protein